MQTLLREGFSDSQLTKSVQKTGLWSKKLSSGDIEIIWETVAGFIEDNLANGKGVVIPGFGTFSLLTRQTIIGPNNKIILTQRPVFTVSEKFIQKHGLEQTLYKTPGNIPIVKLNYTTIAFETPYTRDCIEGCVKEVLIALDQAVHNKGNVEFVLKGIGRLQIRDGEKVKMKFYKPFVNKVDPSKKSIFNMQGRPNTMDSVISERPDSHLPQDTLILPAVQALATKSPKISLEKIEEDPAKENDVFNKLEEQLEELWTPKSYEKDTEFKSGDKLLEQIDKNPNRVILSQAGFLPFDNLAPEKLKLPSPRKVNSPTFFEKNDRNSIQRSADYIEKLKRNQTFINSDRKSPSKTSLNLLKFLLENTFRPNSASSVTNKKSTTPICSHSYSHGQELCYFCHQRSSRNVALDLKAIESEKMQTENKFWYEMNKQNDLNFYNQQKEKSQAKREETKNVADFNYSNLKSIKNFIF